MKGFATGLLNFLLFLSLSAFGLVLTLNSTLLNQDFVVSELDELDTTALIKEQLAFQIPQEFAFMNEAIDTTIADLEPWLKEQARNGIYTTNDSLTGRSQSLSIVISTEPITESIRDNAWEAVQKSPPPELANVPPAMVEQYFNQIYDQQIAQLIPPTFEIDESLLGPQVIGWLEPIRQAFSYFDIAYKGLISLMILLIACIILINRELRASARSIGITFTTYGAIEYGGIFAAIYFAAPQITNLGIPVQLQKWLPQLLDNIMAPLQTFSLRLLIAGVALITVSYIYKPRPSSS